MPRRELFRQRADLLTQKLKDPAAALVADRRGDILLAQGKPDDAKAAYTKAWQAMDAKLDYRRLVEAKLTALGAAPAAETPKTDGAAK